MSGVVIALLAVAAAVAAWFAEHAAIHAAGYTGFGGAGWITAVVIPLGAAAWVRDKLSDARGAVRWIHPLHDPRDAARARRPRGRADVSVPLADSPDAVAGEPRDGINAQHSIAAASGLLGREQGAAGEGHRHPRPGDDHRRARDVGLQQVRQRRRLGRRSVSGRLQCRQQAAGGAPPAWQGGRRAVALPVAARRLRAEPWAAGRAARRCACSPESGSGRSAARADVPQGRQRHAVGTESSTARRGSGWPRRPSSSDDERARLGELAERPRSRRTRARPDGGPTFPTFWPVAEPQRALRAAGVGGGGVITAWIVISYLAGIVTVADALRRPSLAWAAADRNRGSGSRCRARPR